LITAISRPPVGILGRSERSRSGSVSRGDTVYFLSGGGDESQWVKNFLVDDRVTVRLGRKTYPGKARLVKDKNEDAKARRLLAAKYQGWLPGKRMSGWANNSLAVAVDLHR
jgi:hypothetical protein